MSFFPLDILVPWALYSWVKRLGSLDISCKVRRSTVAYNSDHYTNKMWRTNVKFQQVPTSKNLQTLGSDGTDTADTHSMPTGASSEQIEVKDEREATPSRYGSYGVRWMRIESQRMASDCLEIPKESKGYLLHIATSSIDIKLSNFQPH